MTGRDGSGNHVPERKSFPPNDHRLKKLPEFVLQLFKCAALTGSCHDSSQFSAHSDRWVAPPDFDTNCLERPHRKRIEMPELPEEPSSIGRV